MPDRCETLRRGRLNDSRRRGRLWGPLVPAAPAEYYLYKFFIFWFLLLLAFGPSIGVFIGAALPSPK